MISFLCFAWAALIPLATSLLGGMGGKGKKKEGSGAESAAKEDPERKRRRKNGLIDNTRNTTPVGMGNDGVLGSMASQKRGLGNVG